MRVCDLCETGKIEWEVWVQHDMLFVPEDRERTTEELIDGGYKYCICEECKNLVKPSVEDRGPGMFIPAQKSIVGLYKATVLV